MATTKTYKDKTITAEKTDFKNIIEDKKDIIKQYILEKDYAVKLRQVKVNNWIKNEEAYNGIVQRTLLTRSNIHMPVVFEGVQNMASKLGSVPEVEYDTIPEGDENAAEIMEHVVKQDLDECNFDLIYENSKVEGGIYGRSIWEVIPGNERQKVELVDTLAFLISPIAKDTRTGLYQGRQFIYKTMEQLLEEADEMKYDTEELDNLKKNKIPAEAQQDSSVEASIKNIRMATLGLSNVTQYGSKVAELTSWWTYLCDKDGKGTLYNLIVANDRYLLRCVKAEEVGLDRPPFISWGTYTRGITFLSPSVADIYRDTNLAVDVSINQGIDNNTYRNFGMIYVASSSGLKQSSIVPRPLGVTSVMVGPNETIQNKIWQPTIPEITSGLQMIQAIKGFSDSASGLSPNIPPKKGKTSVTEMSKLAAEVDARVMVMRKNITNACEELFQVMADITTKKLTKPRKVKIFGYKNLTIEDVTKKNFKDVELVAKAIPAEDNKQNQALKQKAKIELYTLFKDDPKIPGQLALRRSVAKTFDIPPEEIEALFTKEEQPKPEVPIVPGADGAGAEKPAMPGNPGTEATPALSQTGKEAAAVVPRTVQPLSA